MAATEVIPRLWECGYYSFLEALSGWETGRPIAQHVVFFRLNDARSRLSSTFAAARQGAGL
jgi:hypothetical protein